MLKSRSSLEVSREMTRGGQQLREPAKKISSGIGEYLYIFAHGVMTNAVSVSVITPLLVGPVAPA